MSAVKYLQLKIIWFVHSIWWSKILRS